MQFGHNFITMGRARRPGLATLNTGGGYSIEQFLSDIAADGRATDAIYAFTAADALTDLSGNARNLTVTETVTFLDGFGLQGDAETGKLVGVGTPASLTNFLQDDCSITLLLTKQITAGNQFARDGGSGQVIIDTRHVTPNIRLNNTSSATFTADNSVGAITVWRDPADPGKIYFLKDDGVVQVKSSTSTTKQASPLSFFRSNTSHSGDTIFAAIIGAGVNETIARARNRAAIRIARANGWTPPPAPIMTTLYPVGFQTHPDGPGSGTGKGIVCTGLCPDGSGGLWSCDDGRSGPGDTTHQPLVRHYHDATDLSDFTDFPADEGALAAHFSGLGIDTTSVSFQGIALRSDAGQVQFVARDLAGPAGSAHIVSMDGDDGTNVTSWSSTGANGLATINGKSVILGGRVIVYNPEGGLSTLSNGIAEMRPAMAQPDHLSTDPTEEWVLVSGGPNGSPGTLEVWSINNQWNAPVLARIINLVGAEAMEGTALIGSADLYGNSDRDFHPDGIVNPADQTNRLVHYDFTGMLSF